MESAAIEARLLLRLSGRKLLSKSGLGQISISPSPIYHPKFHAPTHLHTGGRSSARARASHAIRERVRLARTATARTPAAAPSPHLTSCTSTHLPRPPSPCPGCETGRRQPGADSPRLSGPAGVGEEHVCARTRGCVGGAGVGGKEVGAREPGRFAERPAAGGRG